jgi:nucleoid-associated protein YgaU
MSRRNGRHAKLTARQGRHAKPAPPSPAAIVLGTAAKAVPASLVIGAATSAFALSGTASAATTAPSGPASGGAAHIAAVTTAATHTLAAREQRSAGRSSHKVIPGDTLSRISARFCGTSADYPALAAASGIANPNLIYVGQEISLACHAAPAAAPTTATSDTAASGSPSSPPAPQPSTQAQAPAAPSSVSTSGMSAFESCVISRESGGNPQAVNASSGAGGLYQFLPSTWASLGYASSYPGGAQTAPVSVQKAAFAKLYAQAGTSPWSPSDGC